MTIAGATISHSIRQGVLTAVPRRAVIRLRRATRAAWRRKREARLFATAMTSIGHPILAQVVVVRRCNLSCGYCNEFDRVSRPVPFPEMVRRIDRLGELHTAIIMLTGGEPLLHPAVEAIIARIRSTGAMAAIITNGHLLTPEKIGALNRAGLDYMQISIDNIEPDEVSRKSLTLLDAKLEWLAAYATFAVTVNTVLGPGLRSPEDALTIARRGRALGFNSTVGILHDGTGRTKPLPPQHIAVYEELRKGESAVFSFSHLDRFQRNLVHGTGNDWRCRAGSRFLYVCEDGLVHYCSQQRGTPAIPLLEYTRGDLEHEFHSQKACAPRCSLSCVHQVAFLDEVRADPLGMLREFVSARQARDPSFRLPLVLRAVAWALLDNPGAARWGRLAARVLGAPCPAPPTRPSPTAQGEAARDNGGTSEGAWRGKPVRRPRPARPSIVP